MHRKDELLGMIKNHEFSDIQITVLDRINSETNRTTAKAFTAKIESRLMRRQDSDIILVAMTAKPRW